MIRLRSLKNRYTTILIKILRGGGNLEGCPTFKAKGRPSTNPTGAWEISRVALRSRLKVDLGSRPDRILARNWEKNRKSRSGNSINFYGDYLNNGITSNGNHATNISHTKCRHSFSKVEEKVNPVKSTIIDLKIVRHIKRKPIYYNENLEASNSSDSDYSEKKRVNKTRPSYEIAFQKIEKERKWHLSSGRSVEDLLYAHSSKFEYEQPVHSFIVDTSDDNIKNLFIKKEWEEIMNTNRKTAPG
ncbi:hypothetical protein G9A89_015037 [Geosiphon pyriformis]|nr:hypothetical protein G9A89_015037 [Geosiphon pyriformis]